MLKRPLDFCFWQGATPCLEFTLPVELADGDVAYITIAQADQVVLEYQLNGTPAADPPTGTVEIDADDSRLLRVRMTQADTLRLEQGDAAVQVRVLTEDGADTFVPVCGWVGGADKQGVIT